LWRFCERPVNPRRRTAWKAIAEYGPHSMKIAVNGELRDFPEQTTVADVLRSMRLEGRYVAVECNLEIVERSKYPSLLLQDGDRLEIVHAIGGGAHRYSGPVMV